MRHKAVSCLSAAILLLQAVATTTLATPTAPVLMVNHSTKECVRAIQGDDCHWCDPPEGWVVLDYASDSQCPDGYTDRGHVGMVGQCRGYKSQFCCSNGPHHGDCQDFVINEALSQCAFVQDIAGCTLPVGWVSAADDTSWSGRCPYGHQWVGDVACVVSGTTRPTEISPLSPNTEPAVNSEPASSPEPTATTEPTITREPTSSRGHTATRTPGIEATGEASASGTGSGQASESRSLPAGVVFGLVIAAVVIAGSVGALLRSRARRGGNGGPWPNG